MKKAFQILCAAIFTAAALAGISWSQTNGEKRVIEVIGLAETLVTPNEFTFKVTLVERIEKKEKLTIKMQEEN